jgi:hypothetical protein
MKCNLHPFIGSLWNQDTSKYDNARAIWIMQMHFNSYEYILSSIHLITIFLSLRSMYHSYICTFYDELTIIFSSFSRPKRADLLIRDIPCWISLSQISVLIEKIKRKLWLVFGSCRFESRPKHWLFWLRMLVLFVSHSVHLLRHDRFCPHHFQFTINY